MKRTMMWFAVLFAGVAFASHMKSNIASREISLVEEDSTPTAKSYIRNGLIAMWDGIENAGYGKHDSTAVVWVDLIGGKNNWTISVHGSWDDNGLRSDGAGFAAEGATISVYTTLESSFVALQSANSKHILTTSKSTNYDEAIYFYMSSSTEFSFGRLLCFPRDGKTAVTLAFVTSGQNATALVSGYMNSEKITKYSLGDYMAAGCKIPTIFGRKGGDRNLKGIMHCIRVYNRALTDAEIAHNYTIDKIRFGIK